VIHKIDIHTSRQEASIQLRIGGGSMLLGTRNLKPDRADGVFGRHRLAFPLIHEKTVAYTHPQWLGVENLTDHYTHGPIGRGLGWAPF
jgi:hypothetical protein